MDTDLLFQLQAELCRTLADPTRLHLLEILRGGPRPVKDLVTATGQRQAKISQHLALLRAQGIVRAARLGNEVHYSIADQRIVEACAITRGLLLDRLRQQGELARSALGVDSTPPRASQSETSAIAAY